MQVSNLIFVLLLATSPFIQADEKPPETFSQSLVHSSDYYESGLRELKKGKWKAALNIWLKAKTSPAVNTPDPRIGFAFIEVVTEKNAVQYYELADEMYFWGIESEDIERYRDAFHKELLRLQPIMDETFFLKLDQNLKKNNIYLTALLREFWIKQDPYPSSSYNERLIEHWSRIVYARANYTYASDTVYDTDDRGLIYVRFGKPFKIKKRNVSINGVIDPVTGARIDLFNNISFDLEIWYYMFDGNRTSFAFGRPGTGGSYGLQPGILSMVPVAGNRISSYYDEQENAFNATQQSDNRDIAQGAEQQDILALPGHTPVSRDGAELMIKYAVLEDIGAIDPFYNELYNQMTRDIIRAELSGSGEKFTKSAQTNLSRYNQKERSASMLKERLLPVKLSDTKSIIENLTMRSKFYRFLDEDFNPLYMLVTEAIDFTPIILHLERDDDSAIYQLNTLYLYDEEWKLKTKQPHILPLNEEGHFGKGIYYFDAGSTGGHILLEAQFLDKNPGNSAKKIHPEFNAEILASTYQQEISFPEKLHLDETLNIQLSDIIMGGAQPEEEQNRIPFTPNITSVFEAQQEIVVYFEVYNLPKGKGYQIEYFFEESNKKRKKKSVKRSIILNYTSASKLDKKWFTASLKDLEEGKEYNLVIKLSLPDALQTITRRVTFTTVKR